MVKLLELESQWTKNNLSEIEVLVLLLSRNLKTAPMSSNLKSSNMNFMSYRAREHSSQQIWLHRIKREETVMNNVGIEIDEEVTETVVEIEKVALEVEEVDMEIEIEKAAEVVEVDMEIEREEVEVDMEIEKVVVEVDMEEIEMVEKEDQENPKVSSLEEPTENNYIIFDYKK